MDLEKLQKDLGYTFTTIGLLENALVHRSYLNEKHKNQEVHQHNERLEFLGDAVLELVVTDYLYNHLQEAEGMLTSLRAALVNFKTMAEVGMNLNLENHMLISKGEKEDSDKSKLSIVADCMEAIIGAMYLDGGIEPCAVLIKTRIISLLPEIIRTESYRDGKTIMQEFCQKHTKITPRYRVIATEGKDHEKTFKVGVWVGQEMLGEGEGRSKQDAETAAADEALKVLEARYPVDVRETQDA
jgi:ribonuclease III